MSPELGTLERATVAFSDEQHRQHAFAVAPLLAALASEAAQELGIYSARVLKVHLADNTLSGEVRLQVHPSLDHARATLRMVNGRILFTDIAVADQTVCQHDWSSACESLEDRVLELASEFDQSSSTLVAEAIALVAIAEQAELVPGQFGAAASRAGFSSVIRGRRVTSIVDSDAFWTTAIGFISVGDGIPRDKLEAYRHALTVAMADGAARRAVMRHITVL